MVLAALAVAVWMNKGTEASRAKRTATSPKTPEEPATPTYASSATPGSGWSPDPQGGTAWRLEIEIRDEAGTALGGRVYVTDSTGDLLSAKDTEPRTPLVQTVRGCINVIAYTHTYVPQEFRSLTPPQGGVRALVAVLQRGPGIEGTVVDDQGAPVTSRRAPLLTIRAHALTPPSWLAHASEAWRRERESVTFWSRPKEDGSFRIDGLPPGRYEIYCGTPPGGLGMRDREPLLQRDPVLARAGDTDVRVMCMRAVEVHIALVDDDTGTSLPEAGTVMQWRVMDRDRYLSSGIDATRRGVIVNARPGAVLSIAVAIEGYLSSGPFAVAVDREPGRQKVTLPFRRDVGSISLLELRVRDDSGQPAYPLMIGRPLAGMTREDSRDGRYALRLPAGRQTVRVESPAEQRMLFAREWVPSSLNPDEHVGARVYLPTDLEVEVPRGGRIAHDVTMQRAAFVWIRQEPSDAFSQIRLLRGGREWGAYELYEGKGLAAAVEPGTYTVEGRAGDNVVSAEVTAGAAEVAEVWLRIVDAK